MHLILNEVLNEEFLPLAVLQLQAVFIFSLSPSSFPFLSLFLLFLLFNKLLLKEYKTVTSPSSKFTGQKKN